MGLPGFVVSKDKHKTIRVSQMELRHRNLAKSNQKQKEKKIRDRLSTPVFLGFPCGSAVKECACNAGDLSSIPKLGRSPGEGNGYPLQYSGLENSMDSIVHGVAKNWIRLSYFHFELFHLFE